MIVQITYPDGHVDYLPVLEYAALTVEDLAGTVVQLLEPGAVA